MIWSSAFPFPQVFLPEQPHMPQTWQPRGCRSSHFWGGGRIYPGWWHFRFVDRQRLCHSQQQLRKCVCLKRGTSWCHSPPGIPHDGSGGTKPRQRCQAKSLTPGALQVIQKAINQRNSHPQPLAKAIEVRLHFCSRLGGPQGRHDRCGCFHIKINKILAENK